MKFKKEIKELEEKLEALKRKASKEEGEVVEVSAATGCFEDMPTENRCGVLYKTFKLFPVTSETYTHEEACEKFNKSDKRLMTKEELYLLLACGIDLGNNYFWSASVLSSLRLDAWAFNGPNGNLVSDGIRLNGNGVRCVGRV